MELIRKKPVCFVLFLLLMVLPDCKSETTVCKADTGYICVKTDPNTRAFMTAVSPQLDAMNKQAIELMSQHKWLKHRLDVCIKHLEDERGLEPILFSIKSPLPLKGDPNHINEYSPKDEPLFMPYESPDVRRLGDPNNIHLLRALLNLHILSINMYVADANNRIVRFEERLKRLEENLNK